jgi:hypothetical protein
MSTTTRRLKGRRRWGADATDTTILWRLLDRRRLRRWSTAAVAAVVALSLYWVVGAAFADAGNPILGTINGSLVTNSDGTVTVTVKGQWHWYSHTSDCNTDRAGAGVGIIWNDPTEPGYTVAKGSISQGVGISKLRPGDTVNSVDQMAHPSDVGNLAEGYPGYAGQTFNDPSPADPNSYLSWKGGCGREAETATASACTPGSPSGQTCVAPLNPSLKTCADATLICGGAAGTDPATGIKIGANAGGHPWGSWGYTVPYSHTYAKRSDVSQVCVNFYDVHGGGTGTKLQLVNGAKEITVNGNGDNSIQTNAFNPAVGANCISFPYIKNTVAATDVIVGNPINDTAFIAGAAASQTLYVQFHLFAPGDSRCTGSDLYTGGRKSLTTDGTGNGSVASDSVSATLVGDYHWTADLYASSASTTKLDSTKCGDTGETSHVIGFGAIKIVKKSSKAAATPLGGAKFDICTNSDATSTKCTAPTVPSGFTNPVGPTSSTDGSICVGGLTLATYYVVEVTAPSGYSNDSGLDANKQADATSNATCGGTPVVVNFTDTPLTDLSAEAKSQVKGGTQSTINCVDKATGKSVGSGGAQAEDSTLSAPALPPGTYTCTFGVDP